MDVGMVSGERHYDLVRSLLLKDSIVYLKECF
jgi:hypothetical protein